MREKACTDVYATNALGRLRPPVERLPIFSSLAQTTKLQEGNVIGLFQALFAGSASEVHAQVLPATLGEK